MSKRPTIKKITQAELPEPEGDECVYYLSYSDDMSQIMLSVHAGRSITPEEYLDALAAFIDDVSEFPQNLFIDEVNNEHLN